MEGTRSAPEAVQYIEAEMIFIGTTSDERGILFWPTGKREGFVWHGYWTP